MTEVKIDPKLTAPAVKALEPHADALLAAPLGTRVVAVVELAVVEHAERGDSDDQTTHVVKARPVLLEIADGDDEHHIRAALRALYTKRTRPGTLNSADDLDRADMDIRLTPDLVGGA